MGLLSNSLFPCNCHLHPPRAPIYKFLLWCCTSNLSFLQLTTLLQKFIARIIKLLLYYLLLLKLYNNVLMLTRLLLPVMFLKFTRRKPIIPLFKSLTATILKGSIFSHIVFHLSMKDSWTKLKAYVTLWNN